VIGLLVIRSSLDSRKVYLVCKIDLFRVTHLSIFLGVLRGRIPMLYLILFSKILH